ncbi:MAG: hypothetical protein E6K95_00505 [Thaumarchaeota archaeon]|nr:MAG: hypothetical protein E6K95_00505 [Nitrososphaerota archaeon]
MQEADYIVIVLYPDRLIQVILGRVELGKLRMKRCRFAQPSDDYVGAHVVGQDECYRDYAQDDDDGKEEPS